MRSVMVNVFFLATGAGLNRRWVLVDTGLRGSRAAILDQAAELFGRDTPPQAIILTHGHFDHVGALRRLLSRWNVPVYAHRLELPYITGRSAYPPPDPAVGGGLMARAASLYPRGPIDVGPRARMLPDAGAVPALAEWRWIHTPGHTPGHVSLFRERDRTLIAGDAVITTKQESLRAVISQRLELHGPPAYYTSDWRASGESVRRLADLEPEVLGTGHGLPFRGLAMRAGLHALASRFEREEVPRRGRYVGRPAQSDERGVIRVPPAPAAGRLRSWGVPAMLLGAAAIVARRRRRV